MLEKYRKGRTPHNNNNILLTIGNVCLFFVYSFAFFWLFYKQYYYSTGDNYATDLLKHIDFAHSGKNLYSLMYFCLGILDNLPYSGVWIALFLVAFLVFGIYASKKIIEILLPERPKWAIWTYAWICNMIFPITIPFIPFLGNFRYQGMLYFNIYHNSTYLAMKPFSLMAIYFFFKYFIKYKNEGLQIYEWLFLSGSLLFSAANKPNFVIAFSISMLCIMFYDFFKNKCKNILRYVIFGSTVFPSIVLILIQMKLYGDSSQISIGFMTALKSVIAHPIVPIFLSLVFPIVVLLIKNKNILKDKYLSYSWLHMIISLLISVLLYEDSFRLMHGNFLWSSHFAVGVLFIVSMKSVDEFVREKRMLPIIISFFVIGMHFMCYLNYVSKILHGEVPV